MKNILRVSEHEFSSCEDAPKVVGVGGLQEGPNFALKFAYDTGGIDLLCLNDTSVRHLIAVLKTLVPKHAAIETLPVSVETASGSVSTWSPSD